MDPNTFKHLEYFSVPNNQTINPVDQSFAAQQAALWNAALNPSRTQSVPSSTAPTALSMESLAQASAATGLTSISPHSSLSSRRPSIYDGQPGPSVQPRAPVPRRTGHDRKRSRINSDANPFDSADYWIQFDNEDPLADLPESMEVLGPDVLAKHKAPSMQQRRNSAHPAHPPGSASARLSAGAAVSKREDLVDDEALDNALSDEDAALSSINLAEQLAKIDSAAPTDIPPREGLYSTPLSWERPQPGLRMDNLIGLNSSSLNAAEQRRLIEIAMNPGPSMGGLGALGSNVNMTFGSGMNSSFNPTFGMNLAGMSLGSNNQFGDDPVSPPNQFTGFQSKPSGSGPPKAPPQREESMTSDKGKEKPKVGDRTAHNDIERKYRTNLKDKIAELRDAVPALHTISENGGDDDASQPSRSAKVSKGTILTKATEYIHFLERRNKAIAQEHLELSRRLQAFEQLLNATARASYQMPNYSRTLFDPRGFC
ncbi:helix-loop-helix DNA-binding domain-containing protein [Rhypophila decipiens]|uniref:Helix-loop-helix DNA-binding domain-containing protein n=1 Tax=Rhypophila decipiens TaxID=261697 RepID=A0AAN7BDF3_9PEZI|nr:helix-loop-helix DNA-binding domain-containing protein [Rhypophila decipiens]